MKGVFEHRGLQFVAVSAEYADKSPNRKGAVDFTAHEVIPSSNYSGQTYTLAEKDKLPKDQRRPYFKGIGVRFNKKTFVLGNPMVFRYSAPAGTTTTTAKPDSPKGKTAQKTGARLNA